MHHRVIWFAVVIGAVAIGVAAPGGDWAPSELEVRQWNRYGAVAPRPVNAEIRAGMEFSAPRASALVLEEIDSITTEMDLIASTDASWKSRFDEYRIMQRTRANLISELEEGGYNAPRLGELLKIKFSDLYSLTSSAALVWDQHRAARTEIATLHPESDLAPAVRAADAMDLIQMMARAGFHVHPDDYERLAALELGRKDHEEAGVLILDALHRNRDEAVRQKWHDWILANLPPTAMAHRYVVRQRSFGSPIRLQGKSLAGPDIDSDIDTGRWKGDVIIVDFWGMWCVPCKEAMPELNRVYRAHQDKGLRVLGIFCDHEFDKAREWLAARGYDWPQLIDPSVKASNKEDHFVAKQYAVGGFPTVWIIDRKGILREQVDEDLEEAVLRYLNEK